MLTIIIISSLLCYNDTIFTERLKSINYFRGEHAAMHKHNFGQNLKLQSAVVTLNKAVILLPFLDTAFAF